MNLIGLGRTRQRATEGAFWSRWVAATRALSIAARRTTASSLLVWIFL